jgi:hypothetical protein
MMRALDSILWAAFCIATLAVSPSQAQQQSQGQQQTPDQQQTTDQQQAPAQAPAQQQTPDQSAQPIPAYRSPFASIADNGDINSQQGTPDDRSLSGAQYLSPLLLSSRSYWQPQINTYATVDSNPNVVAGGTDWTAGGAVSGSVDVHRISGISTMDVRYLGGVSFSGNSSYGTQVVQGLGFSDKFAFHRSTLSLFDTFTYLPGYGYGYGGLGGLAGTSLPGTGLGPSYDPGQTALTGSGQTLENSLVAELDTKVSPRGSFTLSGGFYFAHYFSGEFYNSINPIFRAGYNYALSHKDTIAVIYWFSEYNYGNSAQSITSQTVQFSYGRVLTQRLSFQVAAGPQFSNSQIPISVAGAPTTVGSTTQVGLDLNAGLNWTAGRNRLGLVYYHGISPGSGVFAGSNNDTFSGSFTRAASRTFTSGLTGGYSRNQGVTSNAATGTFVNQTYDYWYASASLSHPVGRSLGLTFSYWFQYQNSPPCVGVVGPGCGANIVTNFLSFGVGWHARPMAF